MKEQETVGFIGVGHMGFPMARHLLNAGYPLRVYDVDSAKAEALVPFGATQVYTPAETVEPGGVVFSMVPNDAALHAIVTGEGGLVERIGAGGVQVSCSTVSPNMASEIAARYAAQESSLVVATVSGRPDVAEAAQLSLFCAGPAAALARALPLLRVVGNPERVYLLGERQEAAAGVKLAVNYLIVSIILGLADSAALAEQFGVHPATVMQIVRASPLFAGKVFEYGNMMAANQYTPALFPVDLGAKDVRLMLDAAAEMALPAAERFSVLLQQAADAGWADEDWAVVGRVIAQQAGLPVRQPVRSRP